MARKSKNPFNAKIHKLNFQRYVTWGGIKHQFNEPALVIELISTAQDHHNSWLFAIADSQGVVSRALYKVTGLRKSDIGFCDGSWSCARETGTIYDKSGMIWLVWDGHSSYEVAAYMANVMVHLNKSQQDDVAYWLSEIWA